MNNPPDISPVEHETEEYAHEVRRHVRGYLMVGATLLAFTAITVALSYVNFGTQKQTWPSRCSSPPSKPDSSPPSSCILSAEKRLIYRVLIFTGFFVFGLFWLTYLAWVRSYSPLMSIKGFHIVFIVFSTLLALGIGCYCVWVDLTVGEPVYRTGAIASFVSAVVLIVYGILFYRKMKRLRLIT